MEILAKPQLICVLIDQVEQTYKILRHNARLQGIYRGFLGEEFGLALAASTVEAEENIARCNEMIKSIGGIPVRLSLDEEEKDQEVVWGVIHKDDVLYFPTTLDPKNEQYLTATPERLREAYWATMLVSSE